MIILWKSPILFLFCVYITSYISYKSMYKRRKKRIKENLTKDISS